MDDGNLSQQDYVRRVLEAYRATPGTMGVVRPPDRQLAAQLWERGVPLEAVTNAFLLAAARRLFRCAPLDLPPLPALGPIRSLAYFVPVIEEVRALDVKPGYFDYLRYKIERATGQK